SLTAEIPGYLQGRNPACIEAVTRRLAQILRLPLELAELRAESTEWEAEVSRAVEQDRDLARTVRRLERTYDEELLRQAEGSEPSAVGFLPGHLHRPRHNSTLGHCLGDGLQHHNSLSGAGISCIGRCGHVGY